MERLQSVEWGEYTICSLFDKIKVNRLPYKTSELPCCPTVECPLPALTAGIQNQGLNNYVPLDNATILCDVISVSANGANTGATFYQSRDFTVLQDAYAIKWKDDSFKPNSNQFLFLSAAISKTIYGNYEWTNKAGWERIKNDKISLPVRDGSIDFEFIDSFIAELQAQRIAELQAYLTVAGLTDYTLTEEERKALNEYNNVKFRDFAITEIFIPKNTGNILSEWIVENSGTTPYLCASSENNGVSSYIKYDERYLDKGNCIFIGGKTFEVSYQEKDFYSNDSHNLILRLKEEKWRDKLTQLYIATCVRKSLKHKYSWGDSVSSTKIKKDVIALPIQESSPDYAKMSLLISAIQKIVIKDVVEYADNKIRLTKSVVEAGK